MDEPVWTWRHVAEDVEIAFAGKGITADRESAARSALAGVAEVSWLEQVHSSSVLAARPGCTGSGDALVSQVPHRALVIATADCVPILVAGRDTVGAIHAGWRGLVRGIIPGTLARVAALRAWIGPAIGACCYEVGDEVAAEVATASAGHVVRPGRRGRPHLDLVAAATEQLRRAGVRDVDVLETCTCCDDRLWSYRRDGRAAGRNLAMIQKLS